MKHHHCIEDGISLILKHVFEFPRYRSGMLILMRQSCVRGSLSGGSHRKSRRKRRRRCGPRCGAILQVLSLNAIGHSDYNERGGRRRRDVVITQREGDGRAADSDQGFCNKVPDGGYAVIRSTWCSFQIG